MSTNANGASASKARVKRRSFTLCHPAAGGVDEAPGEPLGSPTDPAVY